MLGSAAEGQRHSMKPLPRAAKFLIAVTVILSAPYVALGVRDALD